jgi:selenocysteine-specific elongation factor
LSRHDRLVLRAYSPAETIGGGVVLDPLPPASGLRRAAGLARFEAIDQSSTDADRNAIAVWLREAAESGMDEGEVVRRAGVDAASAAAHLSALTQTGHAIQSSGRTFDIDLARRVESQIVEEIGALHRRDPLDAGMPRDAMRAQVAKGAAPGFFDAVLDRLTNAGTIAGTDRLSLTAHRATKTPAEMRSTDAVEAALKAANLTPPDVAGLCELTRLAPPEVQRAVQLLAREGRLTRIGDLIFHRDNLARLKADVQQLSIGRSPADPPVQLDVAVVKERYGLSRKYAIPLLEWLDRERVTRRVGASRVVL